MRFGGTGGAGGAGGEAGLRAGVRLVAALPDAPGRRDLRRRKSAEAASAGAAAGACAMPPRPRQAHFTRVITNFVAGIVPLILLAVLVLSAPLAAVNARAAERAPEYTMDNDPIRLGHRHLEKDEWAAARPRFEEAITAGYHLDEALFGLGVCDLREAKYADAEAHFAEALAARGGAWADARAEVALLQLRRGLVVDATTALDEAAAADPKCWAARYGQALLLLRNGEWEAARTLIDAAKDRKGLLKGEDRYHHARALMFLANGALAQAELEALQAQTLDPLDPRYTALVAQVYQDQGHDELAINAWEQMLAMPGVVPTAATLHELGRLYARTGRPNEARQMYEKASLADSTYTPALKDLAELYRRAQRPENAARTWLRLAQASPGDIEVQLGLAAALKDLGRMDEAAAAAKKALDLNPGHSSAQLLYAQAGLRARDPALRDLAGGAAERLVLDGAPAGWTLDDQLALADWQGGQKREADALASLARAAAMDSTSSAVAFQQGLLELRSGRTPEAIARFQRAIALDPTSASAHLNLGIARYQGGDPRGAIADFRRAVAVNGDLTMARLLLGQALAAVDSLPAAEKEYREVLAREATNAKALRGVGFCRLRAGDYAAAAKAYEQSTQAEPGNADGWAGLGGAQLGQGRLDAAAASFAKARAIDPQNAMLKTGTELLNQARNAGKEAPSR